MRAADVVSPSRIAGAPTFGRRALLALIAWAGAARLALPASRDAALAGKRQAPQATPAPGSGADLPGGLRRELRRVPPTLRRLQRPPGLLPPPQRDPTPLQGRPYPGQLRAVQHVGQLRQRRRLRQRPNLRGRHDQDPRLRVRLRRVHGGVPLIGAVLPFSPPPQITTLNLGRRPRRCIEVRGTSRHAPPTPRRHRSPLGERRPPRVLPPACRRRAGSSRDPGRTQLGRR